MSLQCRVVRRVAGETVRFTNKCEPRIFFNFCIISNISIRSILIADTSWAKEELKIGSASVWLLETTKGNARDRLWQETQQTQRTHTWFTHCSFTCKWNLNASTFGEVEKKKNKFEVLGFIVTVANCQLLFGLVTGSINPFTLLPDLLQFGKSLGKLDDLV